MGAPSNRRAGRQRRETSPLFKWREAVLESELSSTRKLVAMVLSVHMDSNGGSCFPGMARITRETSLGRSTVIRSLRDLQASGFLAVVRHGGGDEKNTNRYEARMPKVDVLNTVVGVTVTPVSEEDRSHADTEVVSSESDGGVTTTPKDVDLEVVNEDDGRSRPKGQESGPERFSMTPETRRLVAEAKAATRPERGAQHITR